ncbi:unnamed protein product [Ceratitis capitata]|uniref:(Mediterranean fruit fly) hypothetical protein n=1 Tax=Ceratitis capitata TaxID=7213 RepID=A0A811UJS0_CERCA|nr:unnamed protein product [Ceratitis capitata]
MGLLQPTPENEKYIQYELGDILKSTSLHYPGEHVLHCSVINSSPVSFLQALTNLDEVIGELLQGFIEALTQFLYQHH